MSKSAQAKVDLCRQRYKDPHTFLLSFHVDTAIDYLKDKQLMVVSENVPSLTTVRNTFGDATLMDWLVGQLTDLARFYNVPYNIDVIESTARQITTSSFYHYKVTEIMLCFNMMKNGDFRDGEQNAGKMYGAFSGEVVMNCLHLFKSARNKYIDEYDNEKRNRRIEEMHANAASPEWVREHLKKTLGRDGNPLLEQVAAGNGWMSAIDIQAAKREHWKKVDENHITTFAPKTKEELEQRRMNMEKFNELLKTQMARMEIDKQLNNDESENES